MGRVRGIARTNRNSAGVLRQLKAREIKSTRLSKWNDYLRVGLYGENGVFHQRLVHILVLEAFKGPCPPGHQARHLNDVGSDNRVDNLEWGTLSDNKVDAAKNGLVCHRRKRVPPCAVEINAIREAHADGLSLTALARRHNLNKQVLWDLVRPEPPPRQRMFAPI